MLAMTDPTRARHLQVELYLGPDPPTHTMHLPCISPPQAALAFRVQASGVPQYRTLDLDGTGDWVLQPSTQYSLKLFMRDPVPGVIEWHRVGDPPTKPISDTGFTVDAIKISNPSWGRWDALADDAQWGSVLLRAGYGTPPSA